MVGQWLIVMNEFFMQGITLCIYSVLVMESSFVSKYIFLSSPFVFLGPPLSVFYLEGFLCVPTWLSASLDSFLLSNHIYPFPLLQLYNQIFGHMLKSAHIFKPQGHVTIAWFVPQYNPKGVFVPSNHCQMCLLDIRYQSSTFDARVSWSAIFMQLSFQMFSEKSGKIFVT